MAIKVLKESGASKLRLESITIYDVKVMFYTGFPSYDHFKICFDFLGPATQQLTYRDSRRVFDHSNRGRPRSLPPIEEFFLTLVRLRAGAGHCLSFWSVTVHCFEDLHNVDKFFVHPVPADTHLYAALSLRPLQLKR